MKALVNKATVGKRRAKGDLKDKAEVVAKGTRATTGKPQRVATPVRRCEKCDPTPNHAMFVSICRPNMA